MVEPNAGNGVTQAKVQTHHNTKEKPGLPTSPALIPANVPAGGCSPGQCQFAAVPLHDWVQLPGIISAEPNRSRVSSSNSSQQLRKTPAHRAGPIHACSECPASSRGTVRKTPGSSTKVTSGFEPSEEARCTAVLQEQRAASLGRDTQPWRTGAR